MFFFEFGIRIAVNKPVCLIKDDVTEKIPFDTAIINCHSYSSGLYPWTLEKEIKDLSNHIKESFDGSKGSNSLWKYFSLSSPAKPIEEEQGVELRIDYLTNQIEALRQQLSVSGNDSSIRLRSLPSQSPMLEEIRSILSPSGVFVSGIFIDGSGLELRVSKAVNYKDLNKINNLIKKFGFKDLSLQVG